MLIQNRLAANFVRKDHEPVTQPMPCGAATCVPIPCPEGRRRRSCRFVFRAVGRQRPIGASGGAQRSLLHERHFKICIQHAVRPAVGRCLSDHVPINLQKAVEEVRSHQADIVMLQEVEQTLPRGPKPSRRRTTRGCERNSPTTTVTSAIRSRTRASCRLGSGWRFFPRLRSATKSALISRRRRWNLISSAKSGPRLTAC